MSYIRQNQLPIIIDTSNFKEELELHPCFKGENAKSFEIVKGDLPKEYNTLDYQELEIKEQ